MALGAAMGMTPMKALSRFLTAEWITAISTAVQTIIVIFGVIVAVAELTGHERETEKEKRDAVLRLFNEDETGPLTEARTMLEMIDRVSQCDPSRDENTQPQCTDKEAVAKLFAGGYWQRAQPFRTHLGKIAACARSSVCDPALLLDLFCGDFSLLQRADHAYDTSHGWSSSSWDTGMTPADMTLAGLKNRCGGT